MRTQVWLKSLQIWRIKALLALWLMLLGWGVAGSAGAATYAYRNDTFSYDTPSGAASSVTWHISSPAPACTGYPNGDDDWADIAFPAGFSFTFGGTNYTGVRVYSNGILAFGSDVSGFHRDYTPQALPAPAGQTYAGCPTAAPVNVMMAYWIDIVAGTANSTTGAAVKYELLGTAPNRRFVVSWDNVKLYNSTTRYNFQIALYESTAGTNGNFRYQYTTGSSTGTNAAVGVQLSATDYTEYAYNQAFIDTVNGTAILWYPANQLATKAAEYRFDESAWSGVAGEVKDTSGNGRHASRVGAAANVSNGKLCRGGSFTNNTSNNTIDAVATPVVPGTQGSLDFWYNANAAWNSADTMLFDATTASNRPFFLMKRSTGALRFVISDSLGTTLTAETTAKTFAGGTWHHVGVSWNIRAGTNLTVLKIFLDGVEATLSTGGTVRRGSTNGNLPALGTIYVGDNRTSGVTPSTGSPNGANGIIDEVYLYPIEISAPQAAADMNLTRPACTALDHFHIIHDGTVSNCVSPASITIEAHDASHALFTLAGTSMNLSTSPAHGTWSNVAGGAINPLTAIVPGLGTASYTFANESRVTFGLSNNQSEALNINVVSGAVTEHTGTAGSCVAADYTTGTSCDASRTYLCARPSGFNCVESGGNALTGRLYTKLAGTPFRVDVVALKDVDGDGVADAVETNYAADGNKDVTVELVDGSGSTACASRSSLSPAVSQTLSFTQAGQPTDQGRKSTANLTVASAYPDLLCRVTDANQSPSIVACSSDHFSVRPSAATLNVSPVMASPPSASASPTFKAGGAFTLTATTSAGMNFGGTLKQDTNKLTAQITTQDSTVQNGGTVGTLTPDTLTANALLAPTLNANYTEVGYLYLAPGAFRDDVSPSSYTPGYTSIDQPAGCWSTNSCDCVTSTVGDANLSVTLDASGRFGCSIGNTASYALGRFIPDHFALTAGVAIPACNGAFTYMGQDGFSTPFILTAQGTDNATTQNYAGVFGRFVLTVWGNYAFSASGLPAGSTLVASATAPTGSWNSGAASVLAKHKVTRPAAAAAPASVLVSALPVDPDGVTLASAPLPTVVQSGAPATPTELRYGRVRLGNAHGSELLDLPVTMRVEYWKGAGWALHGADICTGDVSLGADNGVSLNLTAIAPAAWTTCAWDSGNLSGIACVEPPVAPTGRKYKEGGASGFAGDFNLWLKAPGAGKRGGLLLTADVPPWLRFEWGVPGNDLAPYLQTGCGNGVAPPNNDCPVSRVTFGVRKTPLIFRQERF